MTFPYARYASGAHHGNGSVGLSLLKLRCLVPSVSSRYRIAINLSEVDGCFIPIKTSHVLYPMQPLCIDWIRRPATALSGLQGTHDRA